MRRAVAAVAAVLLTAVFLGHTPAQAVTSRPAWPSPVVYVEDHAGPRWHVHRAAERLDNRSGLNLITVDQCPPEQPCIRVYAVTHVLDRNGPALYGLTTSYLSDGVLTRADVKLENAWHLTARHRTTITEHELGHAVGLPHDNGHDLMNPSPTTRHLSRHELDELRARYGR